MLFRAFNQLFDSVTNQKLTVCGTPRDHFLEGSAEGVYLLKGSDGVCVVFSREVVESERFTLVAV